MNRMNTNANIMCDQCHIVYDTRKMKTHRKFLKDEEKTEIRWHSCPCCGKRTIIGITNTEIRKMIKQQEKKTLIKAKETLAAQKYQNEIDKILEGKDEKIHR